MQQQMERMHKMNLETTQEVMRSMTRMVESSLDKSRQDVDTTNAGISKLVDRINIAHDPEAKLSKFKDITAGITVEYVLTQWTLDFQRQERDPSVRRVLYSGIDKGGNIHDWVQPHQIKFQHQIDNVDKIDNWTWARFCAEFRASSLNERIQRSQIFDAFEKLECSSSADLAGIKAFARKFENVVATVRANDMSAMFPEEYLAMKLFRALPAEFRAQMNLFPRHPPHKEQDMRFDYNLVKSEIAEVLLWDNTIVHYAAHKQVRGNNVQVQGTPARAVQPEAKGGSRLGVESDYIARIRIRRDVDDAGLQKVTDWLENQKRHNRGLAYKFVELRPLHGDQPPRKQFMLVHAKPDQLKSVLRQAQTAPIAPVVNLDELSREEPRPNVAGTRGGPRVTAAASSAAPVPSPADSAADKSLELQQVLADRLSALTTALTTSGSNGPITEPISCAQSDVDERDRQPTAASASAGNFGVAHTAPAAASSKPYNRPVIPWTNPPSGSDAIVFGNHARGTVCVLRPVRYINYVDTPPAPVNAPSIVDNTDQKEGVNGGMALCETEMVMCDNCGISSHTIMKCPTGANYCHHKCQREDWQKQHQQKQEVNAGVTPIEDAGVTPIEEVLPVDDVACLQAMLRRYLTQSHVCDDDYGQRMFIMNGLGMGPTTPRVTEVQVIDNRVLGCIQTRSVRRLRAQARKDRRDSIIAQRAQHRAHALQFGDFTSAMVTLAERNGCYILINSADGTPLPPVTKIRPRRPRRPSGETSVWIGTQTTTFLATGLAFVLAHIMTMESAHLATYAGCVLGMLVVAFFQKYGRALGSALDVRNTSRVFLFTTVHMPGVFGSASDRRFVPPRGRANRNYQCHYDSPADYPRWFLIACMCVFALLCFCFGWACWGSCAGYLTTTPSSSFRVHDSSVKYARRAIAFLERKQRSSPRVAQHLVSVFTPEQMHRIRRHVSPPTPPPFVANFENPAIRACPVSRQDEQIAAARACVSLNHRVPDGYRLGMIDSGATDVMLRDDNEARTCTANFDPSTATSGESANSTFETSGSGEISVQIDCDIVGIDAEAAAGVQPVIGVTSREFRDRAQLVWPWNYDLFPTSFFQRHGNDVLFQGRQSYSDPSTGRVTLALYDLAEFTRSLVGIVRLQHWSNLTFFFYRLRSPLSFANVGNIGSNRSNRDMLTAKWHTIMGHASARRVRTLLAPSGLDLKSALLSPCSVCSLTKTSSPSRRKYERRNVHADQVQGIAFMPSDPALLQHVEQLERSDQASAVNEPDPEGGFLFDVLEDDEEDVVRHQKVIDQILQVHDADIIKLGPEAQISLAAPRRSTAPGQYWHCDTIPLDKCWDGARHALVMVDDFSRKVYVYALKNKTGEIIVEALHHHFLQCGSSPTGLTFYAHRMTLKSDQGSEFINAKVHAFCDKIGCIQEFSCPGGGKWQNGTCERRIKDLGIVTRSIMYTSDMPHAAGMYALYQAADILNALPTTTNAGGSDSCGLPPDYVYDKSEFVPAHWFAFGSYCTVHLDSEHLDKDKRVTAAECVYLCQAHHRGASGHVVWDYKNNRKLTVPSITTAQWNYFPRRPEGQRHLSDMLTFVSPACAPAPHAMSDVEKQTASLGPTQAEAPGETASVIRNESPHQTKHRQMMERHVGDVVRKVFFINGLDGKADFYEGQVNHITHNNQYHIVYWDGDSETMNHQQFLQYRRPVEDQKATIRAHAATVQHPAPTCNCGPFVPCYHPWGEDFRPSFPQAHAVPIRCTPRRQSDQGASSRGPHKDVYSPSRVPPTLENLDYYSVLAFGSLMPRTGIDHTIALASRAKNNKLSAYPRDPSSIYECEKSEHWKQPVAQGNSWYESILSEHANLLRYQVVSTVPRSQVPHGHKIFPTIINFLTKRLRESTPEAEVVDKRKTRICFGGHRMYPGADFSKIEAYAPVPTWGLVKTQLALTALHGMRLKAFDCTAAYLQTELDTEIYAAPPKGLMRLLGHPEDTVWRLHRCLYGHPMGAALWYRKLFTYLKRYGFRQLGNSASFLILDRRDCPRNPGQILLNVYSDDGLASIDNESLWTEFMLDFKKHFDLEEKEPDYFLGCGITQHADGSIDLDPSKYIREVIAKFDMEQAVPSPLPMSSGSRLYMPIDSDPYKLDATVTNLYQQITGSIMYASLLKPELMFYASQLGKVMSCPTEEHLMLARKVLQYLIHSVADTITYRPAGHGGYSASDVAFLAFSDSDWACSLDTRRSHGSYVIMLAGAAITWRSRSHKSVMLSTAAAEYYEASEACREIAFLRDILRDYYGGDLPPTPLFIDNKACIAMGQLPQFTEKQKHIPVRLCHLKECCEEKMVQLEPISTKSELADIGTKALAQPAFERLKQVLIGKVPFSAIHGPTSV